MSNFKDNLLYRCDRFHFYYLKDKYFYFILVHQFLIILNLLILFKYKENSPLINAFIKNQNLVL